MEETLIKVQKRKRICKIIVRRVVMCQLVMLLASIRKKKVIIRSLESLITWEPIQRKFNLIPSLAEHTLTIITFSQK